jgi:hypothetical protein
MTMAVHRLALLLSLLGLAAGVSATAGATKPGAASGTIEVGSIDFTSDFEGSNEFVHIKSTGTITGTLSGPQVAEYDEVVHPTGNSTLQGSVICDPCIVDGRTGTIVFRQVGTIVGDPFLLDVRSVAVSATGGLAGLHAKLVVLWDGVGPATYSGTYHFEP